MVDSKYGEKSPFLYYEQMNARNIIFDILPTLIIGAIPILITGCDQSFNPIKKNNQYAFSIYGNLDATAETQWVRMSPARKQVMMSDKKSEMMVIIEELETGIRTMMRDSLFQQASGLFISTCGRRWM